MAAAFTFGASPRRKRHRIFAAELVRRTLAGESSDAILLGAMRAAFRMNRSEEGLRDCGRTLALEPAVRDVVQSLLDEAAARGRTARS